MIGERRENEKKKIEEKREDEKKMTGESNEQKMIGERNRDEKTSGERSKDKKKSIGGKSMTSGLRQSPGTPPEKPKVLCKLAEPQPPEEGENKFQLQICICKDSYMFTIAGYARHQQDSEGLSSWPALLTS
ncbi:hypothetical protein NDU88_004028 [Pleurodeles waltl]|uniref:Uncharacterized protein n=1 Tax=Pleurodeles waltl TaxID=8319 RepID=A0AAV7W6Y2_PLEWA|nr:hypothetical protein NDU88_004028 [Pleurodeles waltl]